MSAMDAFYMTGGRARCVALRSITPFGLERVISGNEIWREGSDRIDFAVTSCCSFRDL